MCKVTLNRYQSLCDAVAVLLWVLFSVTGLPASLPPVRSEMLASGDTADSILLGGPNCLYERDSGCDTASQECPHGRRGDRQNHQAKAEELLIANHPSQPSKE